MDFTEALKLVDHLVFAKRGRGLSEPEIVVLEAAWEDKGYKEVVEHSSYGIHHLQRQVGPRLWHLLSGILGVGEEVTKKKFRSVLEKSAKAGTFNFASIKGIEQSSSPSVKSHNVRSQLPELSLPYDRVPEPRTLPSQETKTTQPAGVVLGGQPPDISQFIGYVNELAELRRLVVENQCVVLNGSRGVGKSFLAARLIEELSTKGSGYDNLIWKSLRFGPHFPEVADELLMLLLNQLGQKNQLPDETTAKVSLLIDLLRSHQCLLVLDGAEAILQGNKPLSRNPYGKYQEYGLFVARMVEEQHRSCLLLTSQEPFSDITEYQNFQRPVGVLKLKGLGEAAKQIFLARGLTGEAEWNHLSDLYRGNPYRLKMLASYIQDFFAGNVKQFVDQTSEMMFEDTLEQQLSRMDKLEQDLLVYLARQIEDKGVEAVAFPWILSQFRLAPELKVSSIDIMRYLNLLSDRSLVESAFDSDGNRCYSLQPDVKKFVLTRLAPLK